MNISFWVDSPLSGGEAVALAVFLIAAAALAYVYVGYPALLACLSVWFRKPRKQPGYTPTITVIISAYNEEASIGRKLKQVLELRYPKDKLEVIVVSDASTDATDEIVRACRDPRVRLLRMPVRGGKTNGQNEAVKISTGEVLVFSDATTVYHPDALRYLACHYEDPTVGAVSGRYQYFDPSGQSPTGLGSVAFWNYENLIKKFQSDIATLTGCSGCIYSVRRSAYTPLPADACSDLAEPLCVVRKGYRVVFEDRALAYEETTQSSSEEFRMRVRVATRGIRGVLSFPELLDPLRRPWISFQLVSHKLLRWQVPVMLIAIFVSNAVLYRQPLFTLLLALQLAFYATALLTLAVPLHKHFKPLGLPMFFCTLNAAALMGWIQVFRGEKYAVWETVRNAAMPVQQGQTTGAKS
ncbi:MAG TPA: glycosyltransferase family 2 protein [Bryobacteraceae bacterium]|nr:glycosyltransferase family 2 protein [Bryobacteraceae bacterium]HOQ44518.1 glycosyltransferase family 2 protein [Bryobacteraceae bacterium]HPU70837.1 glycosyltransferase family 2 protein [Bryobacteraceae bacterium]